MRSRDERNTAMRAGVMRHIVGADRADTRREARQQARAAVAPKVAEVAKVAAAAPEGPSKALKPMRITDDVLLAAKGMRPASVRKGTTALTTTPFQPYVPPPGVMPTGKAPIAMDEALVTGSFTQLNSWGADTLGASFAEGIGFLGYAYLAALTQRPEYRRISERIATEMTRKWIRFNTVTAPDEDAEAVKSAPKPPAPGEPGSEPPDEGEGPGLDQEEDDKDRVRKAVKRKASLEKAKKLKELEDEIRRLKVRDAIYNIVEGDGWFGRYHLYFDLGTTDQADELKTDIGNGRNSVSRAKVKKKGLKAVRCVEPMWCYPATYDSIDPLKENFYNPQSWYVNGKEIHKSRLLTFVGREVPDILKPAYAFGGLSMSQMAKPYVDNWLRTRQAVCDLIESFSVSGVYTNMAGTLQDGGIEALKRIELFNFMRSNAGSFALDKETEEFFNVSTPLGTLDALQAQAQEQMSSVSGIPLIILLGITPKGLNASSEGEIRAFYDTIHAFQEQFLRDQLQIIIHFVMLSLWGKIDDEIVFSFEPLWSMTDKEAAEIRKLDAETDGLLIDAGIIIPGEARQRVANDPNTTYPDIDPEEVPDPPPQPGEDGKDPFGGDDEGGDSEGSDADNAFDAALAQDDGFNEADHPRADDGKFGTGGGSSSSSAKPKAASKYKSAGKPNWNGGTLPDPAEMETGTLESNARALKHAIKNSPFTAAQRAKREERLADIDAELKERSSGGAKTPAKAPAGAGGALKMTGLRQVEGRLGSNEGGRYTNEEGGEFYIKKPATKAHVDNELAAARLYQLAGVNTLKYRDVEGGGHVATEWQQLDKNNISKFSAAEKKAAAADFAVHAWLSNWDAAGLGGDNQGILAGKPTTLDVGGSLRFRAQGGPKGAAFGSKVTELDTLRDAGMNPDAAGLFGKMTDADIRASIERVTSIPDDKIREAVGDDKELADTLIARKQNMAKRFGAIAQDEAMFTAALDAAIEDDEDELEGDAAMMAAALDAQPEDDELDDREPEEVAPDVFAMDEGQFDESKHKRDGDGKFSSTGAGGGGESDKAAQSFKSKKEHIGHLLTNGTTPKELMQAMGWPSVSMPAQAKSLGMKLEKKDGKYFGTPMTAEELKAAKESDQDKATQKAMVKAKASAPETLPGSSAGAKKDLGSMAGQKAPGLLEVPKGPKPGEPPADYAQFLGALAEAIEKKDPDTIEGLLKYNPKWAITFIDAASPAGKAAVAKVAPNALKELAGMPKAPQATADELKKAKKGTTLPISTSNVEGVQLIKEFNEKYAGKEITDPAALNQKVQDYKDLQANIAKADQKSQAEQQAAAKKKMADLKAKQDAKAAAEKAELQAKFDADPEYKTHYEAMEAMFGGNNPDSGYLKSASNKLTSSKLDKYLTPAAAVPIIAYSGSHYGTLNEQLREGAQSVEQYKFMKSLNSALDKLPAYDAVTYRKASLTPQQAALYQVGKVVEERGFTSTSKSQGTWSGSHDYTIHGKSGRDIQKLSSHPSEQEVLFKSGSRFLVESIKGNHITLREI